MVGSAPAAVHTCGGMNGASSVLISPPVSPSPYRPRLPIPMEQRITRNVTITRTHTRDEGESTVVAEAAVVVALDHLRFSREVNV